MRRDSERLPSALAEVVLLGKCVSKKTQEVAVGRDLSVDRSLTDAL
jgi:hypothetical protein